MSTFEVIPKTRGFLVIYIQSANCFSDISEETGIKKEDVISTMQHLNVLMYYKGQYCVVLSAPLLQAHKKSISRRKHRIDGKRLQWQPKDWARQRRF